MKAIQMDPHFDRQFYGRVCGIDEAGRGPWAGPVIAAAVIWPSESCTFPADLNDSKKLSKNRRELLFQQISEQAYIGIGEASCEEIDRLNILHASLLAMQRAYTALGIAADMALIDGNRCPDLPCPAQPIIKGDARSPSIAAASILAKVTRDRIMTQLAEDYPQYGFERHAGYGTKAHQQALAQYGPSPHHRRSFAPIRAMLNGAAA